MAVVNLFSKRKKQSEQAGTPDVYQYNVLPQHFRVQVVHIWRDAIGPWVDPSPFSTTSLSMRSNKYWEAIRDTIRREKGVFSLIATNTDPASECLSYLMEADIDGALDIIEVSFRLVDRVIRRLHPIERSNSGITADPDDAIDELNQRFRQGGVGYQYVNGLLIRIDSQFMHETAVQPALALLNVAGFEGPNEEFIKAFEHYRHERYKEAVAEALKAFESTMKAICAARKWPYSSNATAKPLLDLLFTKGLIPTELKTHALAFRSAMESGLLTLSNRTSRHGQGPDPKPVPPYLAAHALHLAAANIVFLVEAHNATK